MNGRSFNREKHGEICATTNFFTRLLLLFCDFSKSLAQVFLAESTLDHQLIRETQLTYSRTYVLTYVRTYLST